jgi:hypothetical protein
MAHVFGCAHAPCGIAASVCSACSESPPIAIGYCNGYCASVTEANP